MKIPEEASVVPRIRCVIPETRWVHPRPRCHEGKERGGIVGHRDRIRIRETPTPSGCRVYVTHAPRGCTHVHNHFAELRINFTDRPDEMPLSSLGGKYFQVYRVTEKME